MPSVEVQILQAAEARLNAASVALPSKKGTRTVTPPPGLSVERSMFRPVTYMDVRNGPHIAVSVRGQPEISRDSWFDPKTIRMTEIIADVFALANEVKGAEATDPAYLWLIQALQSEPTLGGICHWISEEGTEDEMTEVAESAELIAVKAVKIHFRYHTRTDDPSLRDLE